MENYTRKEVDMYGNIRHFNSKSQLHRTDGPACIYAMGTKCYYINGLHHRLDGPAIEWANGTLEWRIYDVEYTKEQYYNHPLVVKLQIEQHLLEA
jgi:hypothetical protein